MSGRLRTDLVGRAGDPASSPIARWLNYAFGAQTAHQPFAFTTLPGKI